MQSKRHTINLWGSNMSLGKVYLASGWFNEEWLQEVENIKSVFENYGVNYFSPKDEDINVGTVLINPDNVSSIRTGSEGIVQIVHTNGYFTSLDYKGVSKDKALWYVAETLRLGHHPYASSFLRIVTGKHCQD